MCVEYGEDGSESFMTHGRRQGALMYHHLAGEDLAQQVLTAFTYITYDAPPNTGDLTTDPASLTLLIKQLTRLQRRVTSFLLNL